MRKSIWNTSLLHSVYFISIFPHGRGRATKKWNFRFCRAFRVADLHPESRKYLVRRSNGRGCRKTCPFFWNGRSIFRNIYSYQNKNHCRFLESEARKKFFLAKEFSSEGNTIFKRIFPVGDGHSTSLFFRNFQIALFSIFIIWFDLF